MNNRDEDYFARRSAPAKKEEIKKSTVAPTTRSSGAQKSPKSSVPASNNVKKEELSTSKKVVRALTFDYFGKPSGFDSVFLILLIMVIAVGTVMSFSASYAYAEKKYDDSYHFLFEHIKNLLFAVIVFVAMTFAPPEFFKAFTYVITVISIILLICVLFFGVVRNGAKRWLDLPLLPLFQPSELAKLAIIMVYSLFFAKQREKVTSDKNGTSFLYGMIYPGLILFVFVGLIYFEHHFSAIIIFAGIAFAMMLIGGTKIRWLASIIIVGVTAIAVLIFFSGYASGRVRVFLDPWSDPSGKGWQTIQGLYAIASGGFFGVGLGNSIQKYGYVSEPQNDFIFTIVCEELGFVGAFAVMMLFLALILRGIFIAKKAPNKYLYYLVMGIMIKLALQVVLNIAVVTNTLPNTGISLPFFSSGGTQLMLQMIEMGIVLGISRYCHLKK